jgi:hypothetical protein
VEISSLLPGYQRGSRQPGEIKAMDATKEKFPALTAESKND